MRFLILGPLEVRGDDGAIKLGGIKPRAVLAVLLLHANEPVSAERLAIALWGEDAGGGATKTVRVHVSRLRKALGDGDVITTSQAGYCLRVRPDELDAVQFEHLVEEGRRALAGGQPNNAATVLREALAMWRGPALAELAYEPFARVEVDRLEEQHLAALEARVDADLAVGQHAKIVAELQRLVATNPTRERFAAQLMLALYRCGRQADALEVYHATRRELGAALAIEPGVELRELQEAVLRHDDTLTLDHDVPELAPELDSASAPPLAGREDEHAWLRLHWKRARERSGGLVMLAGRRGAGKSRLAAELAADVDRRRDTVLYARCSTSDQSLLDVLDGLREAPRPTLVVVDDADAASGDVREALALCAQSLASVHVLVLVCCEDSDVLRGLPAERVLTLGPLGEEAVRAIGSRYAPGKAPAEVPVAWLLEASAGVPRRIHEVAGQWARREAARRVTAAAGQTGSERTHLRTIQDELVEGLVELQEARERIRPRRGSEPAVVCPFKGLASYDVADAEYFFGRERLVADLTARIVGASLLGIIGPSGSGKSSVVHAGLLPALAGGVLPGSERWRQVLMRPGAHPLRELAAALADGADGDPTVLVVDQFEETFTVCADESERAEFISELVSAAHDPAGRYIVVLSLRSDHYGRCATYPQLSALVSANNVLVRSMQREELRRAVEGPCRRAGLRIEPDLVAALVADVEGEPGGLPLLSAALLELWQRRDGLHLRHAAYEQAGGVRGAVARLAEQAFAQLGDARQPIVRAVLMRLVGVGDDDSIERRRVALSEFDMDRDEDVGRVVALLTDRRLVSVSAGTIEIAHEALWREWPRLRGWIEDDREGLRIHRRLSAAREEWQRLGRDDGALLRGSRLSEALEWRDARQPVLNELEREYLSASERARERAQVTQRRRTRLVLGAIATVVLAGVTVAVVALFAARARAITASRDLATQSATIVDYDQGLGFALAREALKRHDTAQARDALRQATLAYRATAVVQASKGVTYTPDPSPDGTRVVTSAADGKVIVWRLGRVLRGRTLTRYPSEALSAAFASGGRLVASASYDGVVAMTPVAGGDTKLLLRLAGKDKEFGYSIDAAPGMLVVGTFGDGRRGGHVRLIPTSRGRRPFVLGRHRASVYVVAFNKDATKVVSGGEHGEAYLWDVARRTSIRLPHHGAAVNDASFSPDERTVATAAADGRVRLWDATTGRPLRTPLNVDSQELYSVRFSSDGTRVVTGGEGEVARITDVRSGQLLSELAGGSAHRADFVSAGGAVVTTGEDGSLRTWAPLAVSRQRRSGTSPSFNPAGQVASGGDHGEVHLWDPAAGDRQLPGHDQASITAFSPDGEQLVSASLDGSVRRYDVRSGVSRRLNFPEHVENSDRVFEKHATAMSAAGRIAVGGNGEAIVVQDGDGANRVTLPYVPQVNALDLSPDGTHLASASDDGTVRVWNLRTRKNRVIETDQVPVNAVSYSDDGARLVGAGADGTARIWTVTSDGGRPIVLTGHGRSVNTARLNHRGDRVVTAGDDGTVRVWDARGGDTLVVVHRHEGRATGADFSPDDRRVVSAGQDGVRVTPCEVCGSFAETLRIAATRAPRPLSARERQRLVGGGR